MEFIVDFWVDSCGHYFYLGICIGYCVNTYSKQLKIDVDFHTLMTLFNNMRLVLKSMVTEVHFLLPSIDRGDSQRTLKKNTETNKMDPKSTNHNSQMSPFEPVKANCCFLKGLLR